jgi:hypothetical protein
MAGQELIRVSCSGLVYATVDDYIAGHYSRSKLARDPPKWFMTPFGGRNFHDPAADGLMEELGVEYENPGTRQMNMSMPIDNLERFADWFYARVDREIVPIRELGEELVDEEKVFPTREHMFMLDMGFILRKTTQRAGGGPKTAYFFDVYRFTAEDQESLFTAASVREGCGVRLIRPGEICYGKMIRPGLPENDAEIGDMFRFFNRGQQGIEALVAADTQDDVSMTWMSGEVHEYDRFPDSR